MNAAGTVRNSTAVAFLVDTNILVYRFDPRFPDKQAAARDLLRKGLVEDSARIPHQALLEFVTVVTRVRAGSKPLLAQDEARHETEELMVQFPVLFPNAALLRNGVAGLSRLPVLLVRRTPLGLRRTLRVGRDRV